MYISYLEIIGWPSAKVYTHTCTGNSISLIYKNISVCLQNGINVKQKQRIKRIIIIIIIICEIFSRQGVKKY